MLGAQQFLAEPFGVVGQRAAGSMPAARTGAVPRGVNHRDQRAIVAEQVGQLLSLLGVCTVRQQHHHRLGRTFRAHHFHRTIVAGGIAVLQMPGNGVAAACNE